MKIITFALILIWVSTIRAADISLPSPKAFGSLSQKEEDTLHGFALTKWMEKTGIAGMRQQQAAPKITPETLAFDCPDFAKYGESFWEVRFYDGRGLMGILWINPRTKQVRYVAGLWDSPYFKPPSPVTSRPK